jgi:hypothetical protein
MKVLKLILMGISIGIAVAAQAQQAANPISGANKVAWNFGS